MRDQSKYYFRINSDLQYHHSSEQLTDYVNKIKNKQKSHQNFNHDLIFENHIGYEKFLSSVKKFRQNSKKLDHQKQPGIKMPEPTLKEQPTKNLNKFSKKSKSQGHRALSFSINKINKLKLQLQHSIINSNYQKAIMHKKNNSELIETIPYNFPIKYQTKSNLKDKMRKRLIETCKPKSRQRQEQKQSPPYSNNNKSSQKIEFFLPKSIQLIPNMQTPFKNLQKYKQKQLNKKVKFFKCINNNLSHYSTLDELLTDQNTQNSQKIFTNTFILKNNELKNQNYNSSVQNLYSQENYKLNSRMSNKNTKRMFTQPNNRRLI